MNPKVLETWFKWLLGMTVGAIVGIGKSPFDLTADDWINIANVIWVALAPVLVKWANPRDPLTFKKIKD